MAKDDTSHAAPAGAKTAAVAVALAFAALMAAAIVYALLG